MLVLALGMASHSSGGKRKAKPLEQKKIKICGFDLACDYSHGPLVHNKENHSSSTSKDINSCCNLISNGFSVEAKNVKIGNGRPVTARPRSPASCILSLLSTALYQC